MKKIALIYRAVSLSGDYSTGKAHVEIMPPLWALALATYLRAALPGARVDILDEQLLGRAGLLKKINSGRYALAGLSPLAHTYEANLECARLLKSRGAEVVLGGHYATPLYREILANRGPGSGDYCVDAVVRFYGERAFYELAAGRPYAAIGNLAFCGPGGAVTENPVETPDLAALPPVDYALADLDAYFRLQLPPAHSCRTLPFVAQRGCRLAEGAGRCVFCSIQSSGGCRMLPPEEAARRISGLAVRYGVGYLYEGSDDLIADPAWFKAFSAAAARLPFPVLHAHVLPARINAASLARLRAANARYLNLGIESLSAGILKKLGKGASLEVNRRAIRLAAEAGLVPNVNLILGMPGESRATLSETFAEVKKLELPYEACRRFSFPSLAIFPGTVVWQRLLGKEPKYRGRDLFPERQAFPDWLRHFCSATPEEIRAAGAALEKYFFTRMARQAAG